MMMNDDLPKDWKWVKLGEVCNTTSGGTPTRREPKYYTGSIPWVKSGELDKGLITDTEEKISDEAVKNSSAKVFQKEHCLLRYMVQQLASLHFLELMQQPIKLFAVYIKMRMLVQSFYTII